MNLIINKLQQSLWNLELKVDEQISLKVTAKVYSVVKHRIYDLLWDELRDSINKTLEIE